MGLFPGYIAGFSVFCLGQFLRSNQSIDPTAGFRFVFHLQGMYYEAIKNNFIFTGKSADVLRDTEGGLARFVKEVFIRGVL
jgi:hypothetical protein